MKSSDFIIPEKNETAYARQIAKIVGPQRLAKEESLGTVNIEKSLFLCFTNRCGSNYLSDVLNSTGALKCGGEVFNANSVKETLKKNGKKSYHDALLDIAAENTRDGIFFAKIGWQQLFLLGQLNYLGTVFPQPHFIHIERYNTLKQAISFNIAFQNRAWKSTQKPVIGEHEIAYDADKIAARIKGVEHANVAFRSFLSFNKLPWHHIYYENLVRDLDWQIEALEKWLQHQQFPIGPLKINHKKLKLQKQSSPLKKEWYDRYLANL